MKYLKTDGDDLLFQLGKREKALLLDLLKMYPLVPPAHHKITGALDQPGQDANQALLDEALAEHRAENRKELEVMLSEPSRFQEAPTGYRLRLTAGQL